MITEPLVNIIMPTYNQAQFLPAALDSVRGQTYPNWTMIVVDDGCTDSSADLILVASRLDPRIGYFPPFVDMAYNPLNYGTAHAINLGASICRSPLRTWISSDNVMSDDWLECLVEVMTSRPDKVAVAYGGFNFKRRGASTYMFTPYDPGRLIRDVNCYIGPAFLVLADVWDAAGLHRGAISHDYDHWLRVEEVCTGLKYEIVGVDKALCDYNAHDQRVTITRRHQFDADKWQQDAIERRSGGRVT